MNRRNQRKHHAQIAQHAGPQHGPQLRAKQRDIPQRKANASQAEERIALIVSPGGRRKLIRSEIERSDDDRTIPHRLEHA